MEPQPAFPRDSASDDRDASAASGTEPVARGAADGSGGDAKETLLQTADATAAVAERVEEQPSGGTARSSDALSPSVRRLVRQYDLDVTRIHGTGPDGRIRVSDVVALIGTRSDAPGDAQRYAEAVGRRPAYEAPASKEDDMAEDRDENASNSALDADADADGQAPPKVAAASPVTSSAGMPPPAAALSVSSAVPPVTTVFECDLGRVLAHRKRQAQHGVEPTITSYYLVACGTALESVPEVSADAKHIGEIGVWLATSDGDAKPLLIDIAAEPPGTPPGARVQGVDLRIRAAATSAVTAGAANPDDDPFEGAATSMLVHQHGASGSLLATATPLGRGHAASLGVGRVRKQIVVRNVDGDEGPRVAALAYLTLSFDPRRVTLPRANRFMAELVRALEQWPED